MILKLTIPDAWIARWNAAITASLPQGATPEQIKAASDEHLREALRVRLERLELAKSRADAAAQAGSFSVSLEEGE